MTSSYGCGAFPDVLQDLWGEEKRPSDVAIEIAEIFESTDMYKLKQDELDIQYTKKLGEGAFCSVFPVHVRNGKTMEFNKQLPPFALKQLNLHVAKDPQVLSAAFNDLLHEAKMMKDLKHENILSLLGMGDTSVIEKKEFFIITEMLDCTLDSRQMKWAKTRKPLQKYIPNDVIELRINNVAIPIASALGYLHSKRIIYRDLKPGNIGFDLAGNIKVFDFGLAIKVPEGKKVRGMAGTLRYMAPEMKTDHKFHSFPVDVYSFSILLWEIVTSHVAFKELQNTAFSTSKIPGDKRPNLKYVESDQLRNLLENSWTLDPTKRWDFTMVILELKRIALHLEKSRDDKPSRRSSLKKKTSKRAFLSSINNY